MTDATEQVQLLASIPTGEQLSQALAAPPSDKAPVLELHSENGGPEAAQGQHIGDKAEEGLAANHQQQQQGEEVTHTTNLTSLLPNQHDREPSPSASPILGLGSGGFLPALTSVFSSSAKADDASAEPASSASASEQTPDTSVDPSSASSAVAAAAVPSQWSVEPASSATSSKFVPVNPHSPADETAASSKSIASTSPAADARSASVSKDGVSQRKQEPRASSSSPVRERPSGPDRTKSSSSSILGHRRGRSSSSGGVLKRLTSASSGFNLLASPSSRGLARADSNLSEALSDSTEARREREEKTRKFKSGVNLNSADYQMQYGLVDEPFSEQATPLEIREEELRRVNELAELHQMAEAGGTKAALMRAKLNSIGNPYFPTTQLAAQEVSQDNAVAAMQVRERQERRQAGMPRHSMYGLDQLQAGGQTIVDGTIVPTLSVQQAIHTARQAAADSGDALPADATTNEGVATVPTGRSRKDSARDSLASSNAASSAKAAKRRTFLSGLVTGPSIGLAKFGRGGKGINSLAEDPHAESAEQDGEQLDVSDGTQSAPTSAVNGKAKESSEFGTRTPTGMATNSTGTRRRRFRDTRELEYVASQLALESAVHTMPPEAYVPTVESRRASMMGVLANSRDFAVSPSANGSQASLPIYGGIAPLAALPMPHASFMSEARDPTLSSGGTSPVNGSPRASGVDLGRFDGPPSRPFARSVHSNSLPGSPQIPGKDKMTGIPTDMLAGLGDGPYPTLPNRTDSGDMNGSMLTGDSQYDLTRPNGGRNSLPTSAPRSRVTSSESGAVTQASSGFAFASTGSSTPTSPSNTARRSVLQMSLHNPDAETQGLTKAPKSSKTTPFTSRSPSRNPSISALADKFKDDGKKSTSALTKSPKDSTSPEAVAAKSGKTGIFGRWNKSSASINGGKQAAQKAAKSPTTPSPQPSQPPSQVASQAQSMKPTSSVSSESSTSHYTSAPTSEDTNGATLSRGGTLIPSQNNNLRKVPSPSMTSSSSHDHSALSSDVGGASHNAAASSVTTPDVPSSTSDYPSAQLFSTPATQGLASQLGSSLQVPESDEQKTPSDGTASGPLTRSSANTITAEEMGSPLVKSVQTSEPAEPPKLVEKQIQTGSNWNLRGEAARSATPSSTQEAAANKSTSPQPPTSPQPGRLTRLMSRFSSVSSKSSKKSGRTSNAPPVPTRTYAKDEKSGVSSSYSSMFRKPSMPTLSQHGAWTVEPDPAHKDSNTTSQQPVGNAVNVS